MERHYYLGLPWYVHWDSKDVQRTCNGAVDAGRPGNLTVLSGAPGLPAAAGCAILEK
jgi:hypothetical protein